MGGILGFFLRPSWGVIVGGAIAVAVAIYGAGYYRGNARCVEKTQARAFAEIQRQIEKNNVALEAARKIVTSIQKKSDSLATRRGVLNEESKNDVRATDCGLSKPGSVRVDSIK